MRPLDQLILNYWIGFHNSYKLSFCRDVFSHGHAGTRIPLVAKAIDAKESFVPLAGVNPSLKKYHSQPRFRVVQNNQSPDVFETIATPNCFRRRLRRAESGVAICSQLRVRIKILKNVQKIVIFSNPIMKLKISFSAWRLAKRLACLRWRRIGRSGRGPSGTAFGVSRASSKNFPRAGRR